MQPAVLWDSESSHLPSVMGRLRQRRELARKLAARSGRDDFADVGLMIAANLADYGASFRERGAEGPTVLAFVFAFPDSEPIQALAERQVYFDIRTDDRWDLFFPGYYRCGGKSFDENGVPLGAGDDNWWFSAREFDAMRRHVEDKSGHRWRYSGGSDLVLINAWVPERGEPTVDWESTVSGPLTETHGRRRTLTLSEVIERVSQDLEAGAEDPAYGVSAVVDRVPSTRRSTGRDLAIETTSEVLSSVISKGLGLS